MNLHTSIPRQFSWKEIYSTRAQEVQLCLVTSCSASHTGLSSWRAAKSSCANNWENHGLREAELQQCFAQFSFQAADTKDKHSKVQGHEPTRAESSKKNDNKVQLSLGLKFNTQNQGNTALNKNNWQSYTFPLQVPSGVTCCQCWHRAARLTKAHSFCPALQRDFSVQVTESFFLLKGDLSLFQTLLLGLDFLSRAITASFSFLRISRTSAWNTSSM